MSISGLQMAKRAWARCQINSLETPHHADFYEAFRDKKAIGKQFGCLVPAPGEGEEENPRVNCSVPPFNTRGLLITHYGKQHFDFTRGEPNKRQLRDCAGGKMLKCQQTGCKFTMATVGEMDEHTLASEGLCFCIFCMSKRPSRSLYTSRNLEWSNGRSCSVYIQYNFP